MRFVASLGLAILIGLAQPAMARCLGKYPNTICIYDHGVSTRAGFIPFPDEPAISKYPNGTSGAATSKPAANSATSGETVVLKPSAETGNAWVLMPQDSGGAVVAAP